MAFSIITNEWAKLGKIRKVVNSVQSILSLFGSASVDGSLHATRFLFYQEFQFSNSGSLKGIKTLDYGLESNRLVSHSKVESNFDIFYLLQGASREEKVKWHLLDCSHYQYLNQYGSSPTFTQDQFTDLKSNLKSIGIGSKAQDQLFSLLSAILLLGNVEFQNDNLNKQESCSIKNTEILSVIGELLQVEPVNVGNTLTFESKVIQNELCTLFLNAEEAVFNLFYHV